MISIGNGPVKPGSIVDGYPVGTMVGVLVGVAVEVAVDVPVCVAVDVPVGVAVVVPVCVTVGVPVGVVVVVLVNVFVAVAPATFVSVAGLLVGLLVVVFKGGGEYNVAVDLCRVVVGIGAGGVDVTLGASVERVEITTDGSITIKGGYTKPSPTLGVRYVFCHAKGVKICALNRGIGICCPFRLNADPIFAFNIHQGIIRMAN